MSLFNPQWIQDLEAFIAKAEAGKADLTQTLVDIKTAISDIKAVVAAIQTDIQMLKNSK